MIGATIVTGPSPGRRLFARVAATLLLATTVLTVGTGRIVVAQVSALVVQKSRDAGPLDAILARDGYAPIIIEFAVPNAPTGFRADAAFLGDLKGRIAAVQDAIVADHFGSAADPRPGQGFDRALQRMDITAMISLNVSRAEIEALAADPRIVRIHQNKVGSASLPDSVPLVGMTGAGRTYARGGNAGGRAVAIVDSGVLGTHEFLAGKVVSEACFSNPNGGTNRVSLCSNGQTSQTGAGAADPLNTQCINGATQLCFHGTMTAGIAAGLNTNWNSGEPVNGVARNAQIVAVKAFHRRNQDADCGGTGTAPCVRYWDSDLVNAFNWIAQNAVTLPNGIRLAAVNLSVGNGVPQSTNCDTHVLKTPIDNLRALDVVTVIAAGNDSSVTGVSQPACISTAFAVAASTKADAITSYSNMGPQVGGVAPGGDQSGTTRDILTSNANTTGTANLYARAWGTSMAAPHVAGAFAAIKSACPQVPVVANGGVNIVDAVNVYGTAITDSRPGGTFTRYRLDAARALTSLGFCPLNPNTHDRNADHKSDILWRHSAGSVAGWLMNGTTIRTSASVGAADTNWQIVGQGDFDGDGRSDVLWRHTGGSVAAWLMNGTTITTSIGIGAADTAWTIVGVGDFNGDGKSDILWRHTGGSVAVWLMNGITVSISTGVGAADTAWSVARIGDLDGDGKSDVLWRHTGGSVAVWLMNGTTIATSTGISAADSSWTLSRTGDFNGDGRSDILWRHTGGSVAVWLMNGTTISTSTGVGAADPAWSIASSGDFDGDGKSDILWRHSGGSVAVWLMNGTAITTSTGAGAADPAWVIQGVNTD